jgi:subtilase family serine protease
MPKTLKSRERLRAQRPGTNPNSRRANLSALARLLFAFACFGASLLMVMPAAAQQMTKLTGNHPEISGSPAGAIARDRMVTMMVVFKARHPQELNSLMGEQQDPSSPNYHRWLTPQEFSQRFGPDSQQIDAVRDWLSAQGFEIVSSSPRQRSITFKGSAGLAERVFRTKIVAYADGAYANVTDPSIPARFAGVIAAIRGLDNTIRAVPAGTHD